MINRWHFQYNWEVFYLSRIHITHCIDIIFSRNLPDRHNICPAEIHPPGLGNIYRRHRLIEGGTIHVDGGTNRKYKAGHPGVKAVVLLQTAVGDREGGGAGQGVSVISH